MGLREIRKERGLTLAQVAMLAGVDKATISRAERGLQKLIRPGIFSFKNGIAPNRGRMKSLPIS
jgi:transcriptional regulator with XRE-family HTH domain